MQDPVAALAAETAQLGGVLRSLQTGQWETSSSDGSTDTRLLIASLGGGDQWAALTLADPDRFGELEPAFASGRVNEVDDIGFDPRTVSGSELWDWFAARRDALITAMGQRVPDERVQWIGSHIKVRTLASARLLETWSYGVDIAEFHERPWPLTDRLRHVAHICVGTRQFSYARRGVEAPAEPFRVELVGPANDAWTWGPADAREIVRGSAADFCLLATGHRERRDVDLEAIGSWADDWLDNVQAFALEPPRLSR